MRTMHGLAEWNRPPAVGTAAIFQFRMAVTDRHRAYLARWLEAGLRMGLHDADVCATDPQGRSAARHVVIWVRENADPAYAVIPAGTVWQVTDCIHRTTLGMFPSFEAALNFIRPVLQPDLTDHKIPADGTAA